MKTLRKKEGFKNQKLFVLPNNLIKAIKNHPLTEGLYVTDIGFFPDAQYHYRQRKKGSEQHILIYCTGGRGFIKLKGKRKTITNNSLVLIPAGTPHIYGADDENPWHIYWAHFQGNRAEFYFGANKPSELELHNLSANKSTTLINLFQSIFHTLELGYTLDNIIYISQAFAYLLTSIYYLNDNENTTKSRQYNYVNKTIDYMQNHLAQNLTLDQLARVNNLSKSRLTVIFREKTGYSPIEYFIRLKIQQACRYLDLTSYNINEIADILGYKDPYYFSRMFKKIMGMSPTDYRNIEKG